MSSEKLINSSSGQKRESQDISALSSAEKTYKRLVRKQKFSSLLPLNVSISLNSLTSIPSVEEVSHAHRTRDETNHIGGVIVHDFKWVILSLVLLGWIHQSLAHFFSSIRMLQTSIRNFGFG